MGQWVNLREALKSPKEYGDLTKREIEYFPDERSVELTEKDTGWKEVKSFSTELGHTWYPFLHEGEVYLIAGEVTKKRLMLHGKKGYERGIGSLNKIAQLHGNDSLGAEGIGLTPELFRAMPKHQQDVEGIYWLCKQYEDEYLSSYCRFGLKLVWFGRVETTSLYSSGGGEGSNGYAVRHLVHLPSNIEVYIGNSNSEEELRIRVRPDERENEKDKLMSTAEDVYSISRDELKMLGMYVKNIRELAKRSGEQKAYRDAKAILKLIEQIKAKNESP